MFKSVKLPKTQRFASRQKVIRNRFAAFENISAYMGFLVKKFEFDSRCHSRPAIRGVVVASLSVSRDRQIILQLYAVESDLYTDEAGQMFEAQVLTSLRAWLENTLQKPDTQILGCEQIIVEWSGEKHIQHTVVYL